MGLRLIESSFYSLNPRHHRGKKTRATPSTTSFVPCGYSLSIINNMHVVQSGVRAASWSAVFPVQLQSATAALDGHSRAHDA